MCGKNYSSENSFCLKKKYINLCREHLGTGTSPGPGPSNFCFRLLVPVPDLSGPDDWSWYCFNFVPDTGSVPILVSWLVFYNIHIKNAQKY